MATAPFGVASCQSSTTTNTASTSSSAHGRLELELAVLSPKGSPQQQRGGLPRPRWSPSKRDAGALLLETRRRVGALLLLSGSVLLLRSGLDELAGISGGVRHRGASAEAASRARLRGRSSERRGGGCAGHGAPHGVEQEAEPSSLMCDAGARLPHARQRPTAEQGREAVGGDGSGTVVGLAENCGASRSL